MKKLHTVKTIPLDRKPIFHDIVRFNKKDRHELIEDGSDLHYAFKYSKFWQPQQLLILSDDKISDTYIGPYLLTYPSGIQEISNGNNRISFSKMKLSKKIIGAYPKIKGVPTLDLEFVKEWCKNPVEQIEVKYDNELTIKDNPDYFNYDDGTRLNPRFKQPKVINDQLICSIPKQEVGKQFADNADKTIVVNHFDESDWVFERASGYIGYRNIKTQEWIYENQYYEAKEERDISLALRKFLKDPVGTHAHTWISAINWYKEYLKKKTIIIISNQ